MEDVCIAFPAIWQQVVLITMPIVNLCRHQKYLKFTSQNLYSVLGHYKTPSLPLKKLWWCIRYNLISRLELSYEICWLVAWRKKGFIEFNGCQKCLKRWKVVGDQNRRIGGKIDNIPRKKMFHQIICSNLLVSDFLLT